MVYPASQLSNWKSAPTIQSLWTGLSMRSPGEPTYCQQCPTMPQHTSLTSTSPVTKLLAKWMMTVILQVWQKHRVKRMNPINGSCSFFSSLGTEGWKRRDRKWESREGKSPRGQALGRSILPRPGKPQGSPNLLDSVQSLQLSGLLSH